MNICSVHYENYGRLARPELRSESFNYLLDETSKINCFVAALLESKIERSKLTCSDYEAHSSRLWIGHQVAIHSVANPSSLPCQVIRDAEFIYKDKLETLKQPREKE